MRPLDVTNLVRTDCALGVGSGFFQQFYHRFLVNFFSSVKNTVVTVPETAMKLIDHLCLGVKSVVGKSSATSMLLRVVELVTDMNAFLMSYKFQPFIRHPNGPLWFKLILC